MVHTALAIPKSTGDDVGKNPGPTIFDIIDPTTTVSADSTQGNEAIFSVNTDKQTFQLSRILRETHSFDIFLTPTLIDTTFSR